ncbi:murein hydrolase activator EnvC family protein [Alkalibacillus salilacus]|uniref:Peptidoglycan hydrolase CwlO-like protein n=1 Tax=Alkalibacillus salilacus TaxID=284582 RepID=A0ABT9VFJ3_9BACI|nr:M23 family metallopeptidase [Alkalibacillus salilacus]MDQ0159635.1 peptidoglycan hydrolase CwlO-like protein [Alkalibacillus salilacus]
MLTKKWLAFLTLTVVIAGVMIWSGTTTAEADDSVEEIEEDLKEVKENKKEINSELEDLQGQLEELESEKSETEDELAQINNEIEKAELEIREKELSIEETETEIRQLEAEIEKLENEIKELEAEIKQLEDEIEATKKRIEEREIVLKDRLRTLQKNGGSVRYIEVLMGASDFGDLISRSSAVNKVMDQDQNILDEHFADKKKLEETMTEVEESKAQVEENKNTVEENKQEMESKRATLVKQKDELDQLVANLDEQKEEQEVILANLEEKHEEMHDHKMSLAEEQEVLSSREAALAQEKERAKQRKAEQNSGNSGNSSASSNSGGGTPPADTGSKFMRPLNGYLTDSFGTRGGTHNGIDAGSNNKTTPIYAAASGTVYKSYHSSSYGKVVFITHNIDGVTYDTVYAHMSRVHVSNGQTVERGQQIGNMGSTGRSTGPHLHFELHRGSWNVNKTNAIDPLQYFGF